MEIYTSGRVNEIVEQYETAPPDTQGSWEHRLALTAKALYERLEASNELLRSAGAVAKRHLDQQGTNWDGFHKQIAKELQVQHEIMYPHRYRPESSEPKPPGPPDPPRCLTPGGQYETKETFRN